MYYEEGRRPLGPRKPAPQKRGIFGRLIWFMTKLLLRLMLLAVILIMAAALILYALPVSLFITDSGDGLSPSTGLDTHMINILLLGVDSLSAGAGTQRSDTIIIASVGYNSLKLTSVLRDTIVEIPGHGTGKLNAAYAYGGPELTVRTLNENFGFNITKYAVVDFCALADVINALGGVDVAITEAEQEQLNINLADSWRKEFGRNGYDMSQTSLVALDFADADEDGRVSAHLDGFQALSFARIRSIDSDVTRAHRQRRIISAALAELKAKWYNPLVMYELFTAIYNGIDTNMNLVEMISIGSKAIMCSEAGQLRLPVEGTYYDNQSALTDVDYDANLAAFKEFVY